MTVCPNDPKRLSRRQMLARCSTGFGSLALSSLVPPGQSEQALNGGRPDFPPKAKNVIFCFMSGGVSHVDSFDPKPRLKREADKPMPVEVRPTMFDDVGGIMPSPWEFARYGQSGIWVSELFPHLASCADDLCVIRSMTSKANEHAQANYFIHTGHPFLGHPSAGSWTTYGLGSESENLPGFVVLASGGIPLGGVGIYGNGFLPAMHQASFLYPEEEEPLNNIRPADPDALQRTKIDLIRALDGHFVADAGEHPAIEAAIRNYETAYLMQSAVPELLELSGETPATKALYGMDSPNPETAAYGRECLLARRLVERGVRFVELTCFDASVQSRTGRQSLGPARGASGRPHRHGIAGRPADRGPAQRSQGPWNAGPDSGHMGRGVRSHAVRARGRWSGPQPVRIQHLARGRWCEAGIRIRCH